MPKKRKKHLEKECFKERTTAHSQFRCGGAHWKAGDEAKDALAHIPNFHYDITSSHRTLY